MPNDDNTTSQPSSKDVWVTRFSVILRIVIALTLLAAEINKYKGCT